MVEHGATLRRSSAEHPAMRPQLQPQVRRLPPEDTSDGTWAAIHPRGAKERTYLAESF